MEKTSHDAPSITPTCSLRFGIGLVWDAQSGNNAVIPGELIVEPPTLINLGFEWKIQGDDNRNATVAVQYRKKGQSDSKEALPLLRIGDEKVWRAREFLEYWTPRLFAGSILDLEERTTYDCRFTMSDPDGVQGQAVQQATVTTRSVPKYTPAAARCMSILRTIRVPGNSRPSTA